MPGPDNRGVIARGWDQFTGLFRRNKNDTPRQGPGIVARALDTAVDAAGVVKDGLLALLGALLVGSLLKDNDAFRFGLRMAKGGAEMGLVKAGLSQETIYNAESSIVETAGDVANSLVSGYESMRNVGGAVAHTIAQTPGLDSAASLARLGGRATVGAVTGTAHLAVGAAGLTADAVSGAYNSDVVQGTIGLGRDAAGAVNQTVLEPARAADQAVARGIDGVLRDTPPAQKPPYTAMGPRLASQADAGSTQTTPAQTPPAGQGKPSLSQNGASAGPGSL